MPIEIRIFDEEVVLRLDQFPRDIRDALKAKFGTIFQGIREGLKARPPGKFLDPGTIQTGVEEQGQTLIGFIESSDKPGVYMIFPQKARALRFIAKSGDLVYTKRVAHPFLKGSEIVARELKTDESWIIEQFEEAVKGVQF